MNIGMPAANLAASVLAAASQLAARVPTLSAPPPPPRVPTAPIPPAPPHDFRLTPLMISLLAQPLSAAGFTIIDQEREFQEEKIVHSLAKNGSQEISLLALPRDPPSGTAFAALEYFFEDGTILCLLSEGIDVPALNLKETMEKVWQSKPGRVLRVKWLPWTYLNDLQRVASQAKLVATLKDLFGISSTAQAISAPKKTALVPQDKLALIKVVSSADEFSTPTARRTLLGVLSLEEFSDLPTESAWQAAGALLLKMEAKGGIPHPIRLLIDYLLGCTPDSDAKKTLNRLVATYDFLQ